MGDDGLQRWVSMDSRARNALSTVHLLFLSARVDHDPSLELMLKDAETQTPWLKDAARYAFTHVTDFQLARNVSDLHREIEAHVEGHISILEREYQLGMMFAACCHARVCRRLGANAIGILFWCRCNALCNAFEDDIGLVLWYARGAAHLHVRRCRWPLQRGHFQPIAQACY